MKQSRRSNPPAGEAVATRSGGARLSAPAALTLVYALAVWVPWRARAFETSMLERSWVLMLHKAFLDGWRFGQDLVFTYGPWGFLFDGVHPATRPLSIAVWAMLGGLYWWTLWGLSQGLPFGNRGRVGWVVAMIAVTGLSWVDTRLLVLVLLLVWWYFFTDIEEAESPTEAIAKTAREAVFMAPLLAAAVALGCLIKFSLAPAAVAAVAAITADEVLRRRRVPRVAGVFIITVGLLWIAARQPVTGLAAFVRHSTWIAGGYSEAMAWDSGNELLTVPWFAATALAVGALAAMALWQRRRRWSLLAWPALGPWLFFLFKGGFVRHDAGHERTATASLLLMALLSLGAAWSAPNPGAQEGGAAARSPSLQRLRRVAAVLLVMASAGLLAGSHLARGYGGDRERLLFNALGLDPVFALGDLLGYSEPDDPMFAPSAGGETQTVDVYPYHQLVAAVAGQELRTRPVLHSYSAYTQGLAEMNAAFLAGPNAPDTLLFAIEPIDGRFPAMDDGRSWPELLTRYDVVGQTEHFLKLQRAARPRSYRLTPAGQASLVLGQNFTLPEAPREEAGLLWVKLDARRTVPGAIQNFLYKAPSLRLRVTLRNGRRADFRLLASVARGGFLLSPVIGDPADARDSFGRGAFAALATEQGRRLLKGNEVREITVHVEGLGESFGYHEQVELAMWRLEL